jgi:acyl-CoA reductase-like NAD-dependent aldehyde dehydrogenase
MEYAMLIDGKLVAAAESFPVMNPSTGLAFAECPHASEEQVEAAIRSSKLAFIKWQAVDIAKRREAMKRVREAIEGATEELTELIVREQGKPLAAAQGEMGGVAMLLGKACKLGEGDELKPEVYTDTSDRTVEVRRRPIGVTACITPWNFPVFCSVQKWAPAVVLGNTVVWKPSPFTPLSALRIARIVADLLPPGVLNIVTGDDKKPFNVGRFLVAHPDVAAVSFTGSVPTGKGIMASCAKAVKRVVLEMGGNDAAIVRKDCDVKEAASGIFNGAFVNSGQVCCAIKRCYVHVRCAKAAKVGDGFEAGVQYGPLNNAMQLGKVEALVEDARANGCAILTGGSRREGSDGYFYEPTIVDNIKEGVRLFDEEQFGPVLPIAPYSTDEEAVERANSSDYGLGGSVWSKDVAAGNELASKILAGTVWVNQHTNLTGAPFGGFKQSGLGRELGKEDVNAYTESQTFSLAK